MNQQEKKIHKVVLRGGPEVGKTCLINQFMSGQYFRTYRPTIGHNLFTKECIVDDRACTLQIWDTAGQSKCQSLISGFFKNTDVFVLVYDITSSESFELLDNLREEILKEVNIEGSEKFPFTLVGNKSDLEGQRQVPYIKGKEWAASKGNVPFFEVNAKDNGIITEVFNSIAKQCEIHSNEIADNPFETSYTASGPERKSFAKDKPREECGCNCV